MTDYPIFPAELDQSIQTLKEVLLIDETKRTPSQAADIYLAAAQFLLALKADTRCVRSIGHDDGDNDANTTTRHVWESTPALSVVVRDSSFFRALISKLESSASAAPVPADPTDQPNGTKKRSLSISEHSEKKANGLSPMPSQRGRNFGTQQKPHFNEPVFVATVLFSAFRYLDHWPVPLIKAYAHDSFGPKAWVNHPLCEDMIDNLKLAHDQSTMEQDSDSASLEDAGVVAACYKYFSAAGTNNSTTDRQEKRDKLMDEPSKLKRQLSSTSCGSSSDVSVQSKRPKTAKCVPSDRTHDDDSVVSASNLSLTTSASNDDESRRMFKRKLVDTGEAEDIAFDDNVEAAAELHRDASVDSSEGQGTPRNGKEFEGSYPLVDISLKPQGTRQRYVGENLLAAQSAIVLSLRNRLDVKQKQNAKLVECLPRFTCIPEVRLLASGKLEKWMQTPAVSVYARTLFTKIVESLQVTDPPLQEDLSTIDNILSMKLKSNQLKDHLSGINDIAVRLPFQQVAHNMFSYILRRLLLDVDLLNLSVSTEMKLLTSVFKKFSSSFTYSSIASFLITFLVEAKADRTKSRPDRHRILSKMRSLVKLMYSQLKDRFEGKHLLGALLSLEVGTSTWTSSDEEDKARLIFLSVTLALEPYIEKATGAITKTNEESVRRILSETQVSILTWCVREYGPYFSVGKGATDQSNKDDILDLMSPSFNSFLDSGNSEPVPPWLETVLCLLFIEQREASSLKSFLYPTKLSIEDESAWRKEMTRIQSCASLSGSVSDDLVHIILNSTSGGRRIDPIMALQLLEHLFLSCSGNRGNGISIKDAQLIWKLYGLAEFTPPLPAGQEGIAKSITVPRVAHPNLWWRITMLALVVCSSSPQAVGLVMFQEHPTLCALIKMVTSGRYRFPTIDCDDETKKRVKKDQQEAREKESALVEYLFLPPRKQLVKKCDQRGSRISRRLQKQQKAQEAADALEEATRRKKLLKKAQKSIMLWDPEGVARKPPHEYVDLLLSVVDKFDLSHSFRTSAEPDFLLMTIGETSRSSIERAHDWLIPIISDLPATIARLPPNASCFLLLQAYGNEEEESGELKQLSLPLLRHVKDSLRGAFGDDGAVKALDLLMTDFASSKIERRRCARRVLSDALSNPQEEDGDSAAWMTRLLELPHSRALVQCSLPHFTKAATYEKGHELSSIVLALHKHISFAEKEELGLSSSFPDVLIGLVSSRPAVFSDALSKFPGLFALSCDVLHSEFLQVSKRSNEVVAQDGDEGLAIVAHAADRHVDVLVLLPTNDSSVKISLSLLVAVAVLISICVDGDRKLGTRERAAVSHLVDSLLLTDTEDFAASHPKGLSSGTVVNGDDSMLVHPWMLLAKSRDDTIARRTALSAPPSILCRLLLCSGLPKTSFLTVLIRLGRLGDDSSDPDIVYRDLMSSAMRDRQSGSQSSVARMLVGRLDAYSKLHKIDAETSEMKLVSQTFLTWLSRSCKLGAKKKQSKGPKNKKSKSATKKPKLTLGVTSLFLSGLGAPERPLQVAQDSVSFDEPHFREKLDEVSNGETIRMRPSMSSTRDEIIKFIKESSLEKDGSSLEDWLTEEFPAEALHASAKKKSVEIAIALLRSFYELQGTNQLALCLILDWVTRLSKRGGDPELWQLLFRLHQEPTKKVFCRQLLSNCMVTWSRCHKIECYKWVLKLGLNQSEKSTIDGAALSLFVSLISQQPPPCGTQIEVKLERDSWAKNKDHVLQLSRIGLLGLRNIESAQPGDWPPSFSLLFALARCGKLQLRAVCDVLLEGIGEMGGHSDLQRLFLLRLYLAFPYWMDLASSSTRTSLIVAAGTYADFWTSWSPSLEGKLRDHVIMLHNVEPQVLKPLADLSRRQPLLILRELPGITRRLKVDASMNTYRSSRKGVITGQNLNGQLTAKFHKKRVKLSVSHWGYSFSEPIWIAWLDILLSMPKEVLFKCGLQVGLKDFLGIYLQLSSIQLQLLSAKKAEHLKGKLSELFFGFKKCNHAGWTEWLGSSLECGTQVRHVLMSYSFITEQETRESMTPSHKRS